MTLSAHSQKYYDFNDLNYFIDFSNRRANLKFQDLKIKDLLKKLYHFTVIDTVIRGDSIHWLLQQSDKRNKYLSYLILKENIEKFKNLAKWEYSNKRLEVLASDRIYSGYFKDYFNFVDESRVSET